MEKFMLAPFGIDRFRPTERDNLVRERLVFSTVPIPHPDFSSYEMWRLPTGEVTRLEARTKMFEHDPFCREAQNVYFTLRKTLEAKYGEKAYSPESPSNDADFWHQLITEQTQRITIWSGDDVADQSVLFILICIEAHSGNRSRAILRYAFKTSEAIATRAIETL